MGALSTRVWESFAIFDGNRRLSWKRYEIGPWIVSMTNRKSQVADQSMSIPMTLSDLKRGQIFLADILSYVRTVCPRMTEFGRVTQVKDKVVNSQPYPRPKGRGLHRPKQIFGSRTCAHRVREISTKLYMVIKLDVKKIFVESPTNADARSVCSS